MPKRAGKTMRRCAPPHRSEWRARECRRATSADEPRVLPAWSKGEHRAFRLEPEQNLPHGFEVSLAALILLNDGVDVAKAPLEGVALEDRRGAGRMIDSVDDFAGLVDRPGRGEADRCVVVDSELACSGDIAPDLVERTQQKGAGAAELGLGFCDLRLNDIVVA